MNNNSLTPIIETLEDLYSKFNFKVFNGELETPVITLSPNSKRGGGTILGWFTTWRSWGTDKDNRPDGGSNTDSGGYYEINVCAEYLTRPMKGALALSFEVVSKRTDQLHALAIRRRGTPRYHRAPSETNIATQMVSRANEPNQRSHLRKQHQSNGQYEVKHRSRVVAGTLNCYWPDRKR